MSDVVFALPDATALPLAALHAVDWIIVGLYGAVVVLIGWLAQRKDKTSSGYMLGGRSLPWFLLAASMLATSFSTISLLAYTGKGYFSGMQWTQLWIGELLATIVVAMFFLPAFAKRPFGTAYELLENRFGRTSRLLASAAFLVLVLARAGILLFLTAQAIAVLTGISSGAGIVLAGVVAMGYSASGGLRAVVWTDTIQLALIVIGVGGAFIFVISGTSDGVAGVARAQDTLAAAKGPWLNFSLSPSQWPSVLTGAIPYGILAASVAGTNQQLVQRYMACKDLSSSRRAIWTSFSIGAVVSALTFALGVALFARFGPELAASNDELLPTFILQHAPVGLAGVLVAAIFAAAMSSTDSAVHSMSTATLVDFIEPHRKTPMTDRAKLATARALTIVFGVLGIAAAFVAREQGQDVFDTLIAWMAALAGPLLALFLLALLTKRVSERAALTGVFAGYAVSLALATPLFTSSGDSGATALGLHGIWIATFATAISLMVALLMSSWIDTPRAPTPPISDRTGPEDGQDADHDSARTA